MTMRVSISTYCWYDLPLSEQLPLISEAGYHAISLGSNPDHSNLNEVNGLKAIEKLLIENKLELDNIHAPSGFKEVYTVDISSCDPMLKTHSINETKKIIDAATQLGCNSVVIHPTGQKFNPTLNKNDFKRNTLHSLEVLQNHAEKMRVKLCLENLDYPDNYFFESIYLEAKKMGLNFCFDAGHANVENNPLELWQTMKENVSVLHLHDNDGYKDSHNSLGSGTFPWKTFLMDLDDNYSGFIGLECKFKGDNKTQFLNFLINNINFLDDYLGG